MATGADVDFAADLTILEEGTELLSRLAAWKAGEKDAPPIPMFTSCCPGWIGEPPERLRAVANERRKGSASVIPQPQRRPLIAICTQAQQT